MRWRRFPAAAIAATLSLGSTIGHGQSRLVVVEEAIEGAHFVTISVSASHYGHAVVRTCDGCSDPGISLGINPDTRFYINDTAVAHGDFDATGDGITTVFYDAKNRLITRIKHHTRP